MSEIKLPFKRMFKATMLSGRKTWTSRTRRFGKPGDRFWAFGQVFEIQTTFPMALGTVATQHFYEEGFDSPEAFIECWRAIHPRKGYVPDQDIVVHAFQKLEDRDGRH